MRAPGLIAGLFLSAIFALFLATASFAGETGVRPARADVAAKLMRFDLEASDAVIALNEFSIQADIQVLFVFDAVKGVRLPALHAELDARTALAKILEGSGLTYTFVNARTIAIDRVKAQ